MVGPFDAVPPAAGAAFDAAAGAFAGAAFAGAAGFFSWPDISEDPNTSMASTLLANRLACRCEFMKFSLAYWTSVTLPLTKVTFRSG